MAWFYEWAEMLDVGGANSKEPAKDLPLCPQTILPAPDIS